MKRSEVRGGGGTRTQTRKHPPLARRTGLKYLSTATAQPLPAGDAVKSVKMPSITCFVRPYLSTGNR